MFQLMIVTREQTTYFSSPCTLAVSYAPMPSSWCLIIGECANLDVTAENSPRPTASADTRARQTESFQALQYTVVLHTQGQCCCLIVALCLKLRVSSTVSQQIFSACSFSAIFGLVMFGRKFVAAEILLCKVQCDSVYRQQRYRPKI